MSVEDVAQYLRKSESWVYKNWRLLGGRKLGGSLIFPSKEDLYERVLFSKEKKVAVRVHNKRKEVYGNLVPEKITGKRGRIPKKGGDKKSEAEDANRHGILGSRE